MGKAVNTSNPSPFRHCYVMGRPVVGCLGSFSEPQYPLLLLACVTRILSQCRQNGITDYFKVASIDSKGGGEARGQFISHHIIDIVRT
jgi:hypothetical protein